MRLPDSTRQSLRKGASVTPSIGLRIVLGKISLSRSLKEVIFGFFTTFNILTTFIHKFSAMKARKKYLFFARPIR